MIGGRTAPVGLLRVDEDKEGLIIRHGGYRSGAGWVMPRKDDFPFDEIKDLLPRAALRSIVPEIVDLIPATSWFASLANLLSRESWGRLRLPLVDHHGGCQDCGHPHRLEAHEAWSYDEDAGIQSLDGILVLCRFCHETRHLGRARMMGRFDEAVGRLARINRLRNDEIASYVQNVSENWHRRSSMSWQLRLSFPEDMVLDLRPSVRHVGDGWLVMPASAHREETVARVIDVGIGEIEGRVVLVGMGGDRIAEAYANAND